MIEHAVPVGKVYRAQDMLDDPHYAAREALVDMARRALGHDQDAERVSETLVHAGIVRWSGPETLGEHTEQVLTELLDLTPDQIEKLRASAIV